MKLLKTLNLLKKEKDRNERIQQIDGYRGRKQHCQFTLSKDKIKRRENEKKGMEYCLLAEEYEKKQGYELSIKYYEKGISLLMKSIENLDHKLSKQYKCNKIARYKNNLDKCRQIKSNNEQKDNQLIGTLFDYVGEGNIDNRILEKSTLRDLYFVSPILISLSHIPISFKNVSR